MKKALTLALLLSALTGCRSPQAPQVTPNGTEVLINRGHVHSKYCGHYRFGRRWFYVPKHKHGVDCGHEIVEGSWSLEVE
jgi:hypothetical protein